MPADPILASNPLDYIKRRERMPDDVFEAWLRSDEPAARGNRHAHLMAVHARTLIETRRARAAEDLLRARGDLWKARAEEAETVLAKLTAECDLNRRLLDKAGAENVRLAEAARYENEKVRSLSASVEEWKTEAERRGVLCDKAATEIERLRGLRPELPPYPPEGDGLPRFGLRWNGPKEPLAVPVADGYWTPHHLATAAVLREREECAAACPTCRGSGVDVGLFSQELGREPTRITSPCQCVPLRDAIRSRGGQ